MNELSIFDVFAKGNRSERTVRGTNCVIYTRVSTKEQTDRLSLKTQLNGCQGYAEKHGYNIVAHFGGTYESAQTDERKEFTRMISYVKKSKEKVSYIIVYSLERFSRNENSIWLSGQLRQLGIEIVSVTQPIDTSSASGKMQQKMLFIFGEFDNELRKQKCMAGIRDMLLSGDWPTRPPLGYDAIRVNGKRTIVINARGRLLAQAFDWKANDNLSNEAIRAKLAEKGLKMCHQRIPEIFRNPFYCGLMVHKMLEGKVVAGNHKGIVSREMFLRVNNLLDRNTHGYTVNEENDALPLKRFVCCDDCGSPMTGYIVKAKNIHYYKCNTKGCGNNRSATFLNGTFREVLKSFQLPDVPQLVGVIKQQMVATFNQLTKNAEEETQTLQQQYMAIQKKIERLEERFIEEEVKAELYNKYMPKYLEEKKELEESLAKGSKRLSNLSGCIDLAVRFASKTATEWVSADYLGKQRMQYLLFPEGLRYNRENDSYRTFRINKLFLHIAYIQQVISKNKRGIPELGLDFASFADLVAPSRIELLSKV